MFRKSETVDYEAIKAKPCPDGYTLYGHNIIELDRAMQRDLPGNYILTVCYARIELDARVVRMEKVFCRVNTH
ncbi:UNVERIFIED_ORG: hypothetical protein J2806_003895 [Kosakonia oryzae]|uniref:Uncharacterized protein n=1 Tax=Kosakonia radicincitans TaxID=283686 RepID=A0AAX2F066_9ENTR|nr:hypothetical protein [Kosakonia oryzae]SFF27401.1 hypothetical protein SAMN03159468_04466 [Kosakonia radicincitans]SFR27319.1 hypothetical protein SAMN03159514_05261 [Kosakonia radicincitans]SFU07361.1 hypothetical protein SAMN03159428_03929 [Kosakonia radicincitans]SFY04286.1 hypothetical protein SAMN03159436_03524 [Kosakonia radicincitans]